MNIYEVNLKMKHFIIINIINIHTFTMTLIETSSEILNPLQKRPFGKQESRCQ